MGAAQPAWEPPLPASAQGSPSHPVTLGCAQGPQAEDVSPLVPSNSLCRLWSACPGKEGKKSWPFNHSFSQLSGGSYRVCCCRHVEGTERWSTKADGLVNTGRSPTHAVRSCMATTQMTSQDCSVPCRRCQSHRSVGGLSYCELEYSRRTHRQRNQWVGPWRMGRGRLTGRDWEGRGSSDRCVEAGMSICAQGQPAAQYSWDGGCVV